MAATFEIQKSHDGQICFTLKSANGQVILTGERYKRRGGAEKGIDAVRVNCSDPKRFEERTSKSDQPYFVLKAANGQVIGTSQMYKSKGAMRKGVAAVTTCGRAARTVEK